MAQKNNPNPSGYNLTITGRQVLVTESMKDYAQEKLEKMERFSSAIHDVLITMDIQKTEHRVDVLMKVGHTVIKIHAATEDMYASLDKAIAKLQTRLRRYKSRLTEHHAKPLASVDMNVNVIKRPSEVDELNDAIDEENQKSLAQMFHPEIVKQDIISLKTLRLDEAVMKIDLSDEEFMIFKGEEDQKIKVIYKREDGHFGVVEPECV